MLRCLEAVPHDQRLPLVWSRRNGVIAVVGLAVVSSGVGAFASTRVLSPADAAARVSEPTPSQIAVPVERRALSSDVVTRGDLAFEGLVPIRVQAAEGSVVTEDPPAPGARLQEGAVVLEVAERPVLVLEGRLPTYRTMSVGTSGRDVLQLEQALQRLGYVPGHVDEDYDTSTASAVERFYADRGYRPPEPDPEAWSALEQVQAALEENRGASGRRAAERAAVHSEAEQAVRSASRDVDVAAAAAASAVSTADADVASARNSAKRAQREREYHRERLQQAESRVHPDHGAPPTNAESAELRRSFEEAVGAEIAASGSLRSAEAERAAVGEGAVATVEQARDALEFAQRRRDELASWSDADDGGAVQSQGTHAAERDLQAAQARVLPAVTPSEIIFVPELPASLASIRVGLGDPATDVLAEIAIARPVVRATLATTQRELVVVGAEVEIEVETPLREVVMKGRVESIGDAPLEEADPSRLPMVVTLEAEEADFGQELHGTNVKVVIPVASTEGPVLVVPVAAVFARGDGSPHVELAKSETSDRFVEVETGLSAHGFVEVKPVDRSLDAGDLVVVGHDASGS